jgi:hypothetical protein
MSSIDAEIFFRHDENENSIRRPWMRSTVYDRRPEKCPDFRKIVRQLAGTTQINFREWMMYRLRKRLHAYSIEDSIHAAILLWNG